MSYTVFRSDLLGGTTVAADLVSCRVFDSGNNEIAVENGTIVELKGLMDGERELYKATLATSSSKLSDCVVIGTTEVFYDERKKNLDEFINEAGTNCRGYVLRSRNIFSVTSDGFVSGQTPGKGDNVGIGTNGKLDKSGSGFGKVVDVETSGRYTYYAIQIGSTEA